MEQQFIRHICLEHFHDLPEQLIRCNVGQGNYVYHLVCQGVDYILRFNREQRSYAATAGWLWKLDRLKLPVPRVMVLSRYEEFNYMILTYLEGRDIGEVYPQLSTSEKKEIAQELTAIQNRVATLSCDLAGEDWSWNAFIKDMLDRAEGRIRQTGYFDPEKVQRLRWAAKNLDDYFSAVDPVPYLDDISSKNLLIHEGRLSGIIDVDEMGFGDPLTYIALTKMALLNEGWDTDYADFLLEERKPTLLEQRAFLFYTLLYCVDFMGERGMTFLDKTIPVSPQIIEKLNGIYDDLWQQWIAMEV